MAGTRDPGALGRWQNSASISVMGSLLVPKWHPWDKAEDRNKGLYTTRRG